MQHYGAKDPLDAYFERGGLFSYGDPNCAPKPSLIVPEFCGVSDKLVGPSDSSAPAGYESEGKLVYGLDGLISVSTTLILILDHVDGYQSQVRSILGSVLVGPDDLSVGLITTPSYLMGWLCAFNGADEAVVRRPFNTRNLFFSACLRRPNGEKVRCDGGLEKGFIDKLLPPELRRPYVQG